MTYTDNMNEIIKSFTEYKETVQGKLKKEFKAIITKLFEENSELKAIVWEQFTPYFSDGDPCIFSVGEVGFTNATGKDLNDIRYGEYDGENKNVRVLSSYFTPNSQWSMKEDNEYAKLIDFETCKIVGQLMQSSGMKDVMLATFGDHVKVVATREGFLIDEFDHD